MDILSNFAENLNDLLIENSLNIKTFSIKLNLNLSECYKYLRKEYYVGKFTEDGQSLKLSFYNGQNFKLQIEELN